MTFKISKVGLIKCSINEINRSIIFSLFLSYSYYSLTWHRISNQNLESNKDNIFVGTLAWKKYLNNDFAIQNYGRFMRLLCFFKTITLMRDFVLECVF